MTFLLILYACLSLLNLEISTTHIPSIFRKNGDYFYKLKCYEEALDSYENALEFNNIDIGTLMKKADILFLLNKMDKSLIAYEDVITYPLSFYQNTRQVEEALAKKCYILIKLSKLEEAVPLVAFANAWLNKCNALINSNQIDRVLFILKGMSLINIELSSVEDLVMLDDNLSLDEELLIKNNAKNIIIDDDLSDYVVYLIEGIVLYKLNRMDQALTEFKFVIEHSDNLNDKIDAWLNRWIILLELSRDEEANEEFLNIAINPSNNWRNYRKVLWVPGVEEFIKEINESGDRGFSYLN
jgi:tetratricopeptide (TPR) repeat protein